MDYIHLAQSVGLYLLLHMAACYVVAVYRIP